MAQFKKIYTNLYSSLFILQLTSVFPLAKNRLYLYSSLFILQRQKLVLIL